MSKGKRYPSESRFLVDERTGARIRQITDHPSIHHQPFFLIPAYDDAMRWTVFTSERTGTPQIFVEDRATNELVQLTDRDDIYDFSIHPSHDGQYVYFTTATGGWRVHTESYAEELLIDLGSASQNRDGMAASAGTTTVSTCDRWWAIRLTQSESSALLNTGKVNGNDAGIAVIDTFTGAWNVILWRDNIAHMQFCPDDPNLLFYAGPLTDRVWVINRDGSNNRRLYQRSPGQWITHEAWIPGTRELGIVDWPKGMFAINVDTGAVRPVTAFNAWHAIASQDGRRMVADTNFPDIGIQLFDPLDGIGKPTALCYPEASSLGAHWGGPFPYDDGPIKVYSPQHTHPHPSISPDNQFVIYTSDRSDFAQIYEVEVPI